MNDKVAGRAKLGETQRMIDSLCAVLSGELQFVNITSVNKVSLLCTVDLLYYPKYILWIRIMQARWNILQIRLFYVYETALMFFFFLFSFRAIVYDCKYGPTTCTVLFY